MIEQFWFGSCSCKLLGVLRRPSKESTTWGVLFLPGFGQTKAGSYFIFSQLAQKISTVVPTFQFDYRGWGDSEGETSSCTLKTLLDDAEVAVNELKHRISCSNLILVGSGFGNWVATKIALQHSNTALILMAPYYSPVFLTEVFGKQITDEMSEDVTLIDTALLGPWTSNSLLLQFFQRLGEGLHRSKGILVQWQFLIELATIDSVSLLQDYLGPVLEFYSTDEAILDAASHHTVIALPRSDFRLLHPADRDLIRTSSFSWICQLIGEGK